MMLILMAQLDMVMELIEKMLPSDAQTDWDLLQDIMMLAFSAIVALCVASIVGVVMMNNGKRGGFIVYAISNGIFALLLFSGVSAENPQGAIFGVISVGFIFLYRRHLKWMR
jgi:TRAP-type C4-dicarboxylate transport system permease small subunit